MNQCYKTDCRYNVQRRCTDNSNYKECIRVVKQVLGEKQYEKFLEWEKEGLKREGAVRDE